ncbi:MAG: ABC transporter permease [Cyclobacteriaceae bacterium]|nr:ABC transporter permease [Cyclobacteriaceae bacterium]UYN85791.1 MAG: ABC transporter permease [Cyclobacteriaceae bacterium]
MNIVENMREGLRSVQANLLRSVLTALIVAIGITALVGALTAVDGVEKSINSSLSSLGANTFDITSKTNRGGSTQGVTEKLYPNLKFNEVIRFANQYDFPATVSLSANLTQIAEVKRLSNKTNPNVTVLGANENYVTIKGLDIAQGRNFSPIEIEYGTQVVIIGHKIFTTLFKENENPIGEKISFLGGQFKVIGVIVEKGQSFEGNFDNMVIVPIRVANQMAKGRSLWYRLTVGVEDINEVDNAMGEATGVMRRIRQDHVGNENSFQLERSVSLAERTAQLAGYVRTAGFLIGFVTLLGSSIALMNIMLVSVTERTREIGVRKALGATPLRIRQQFVTEAIVVCLLGGALGVLLGIGIGNLGARFLGMESYIIPWVWIFFGLFVCVLVGLLAGYYPAHKASKLDPIESLRFE